MQQRIFFSMWGFLILSKFPKTSFSLLGVVGSYTNLKHKIIKFQNLKHLNSKLKQLFFEWFNLINLWEKNNCTWNFWQGVAIEGKLLLASCFQSCILFAVSDWARVWAHHEAPFYAITNKPTENYDANTPPSAPSHSLTTQEIQVL